MRVILIRWAILTAGVAAAAALVGGIDIDGGFWTYVWVSAILGLVNAVVRPILLVLTLPLTILTFGLFLVVLNALMLGLTDWLSDKITVDGFWTAVLGAVVISLVSWALNSLLRGEGRSGWNA